MEGGSQGFLVDRKGTLTRECPLNLFLVSPPALHCDNVWEPSSSGTAPWYTARLGGSPMLPHPERPSALREISPSLV